MARERAPHGTPSTLPGPTDAEEAPARQEKQRGQRHDQNRRRQNRLRRRFPSRRALPEPLGGHPAVCRPTRPPGSHSKPLAVVTATYEREEVCAAQV